MSNSSTKGAITKYYDGVKKKKGWESVISDEMLFTMGTQTTKDKSSYVEITGRFLRAVTDANVKELIIDGNKACVLVAYDLKSPKGNTSTKDVVEILMIDGDKIAASTIFFDTEEFKRFMAYNEELTNRIRGALAHLRKVEEKKMFRGVAFMVNGKMCVTAGDNRIMCRIDPSVYESVLIRSGCSPVIMKGREYRGFVYVDEEAIKAKGNFDYWIGLALEFNKRAKASRKNGKRQSARKGDS